jgi:hypothetical protein
MSPADKRLLKELGGRPLFRCWRGWRRGDTKISLAKASALVALGAFTRKSSRRGHLMLVPASPERATPDTSGKPDAWWHN